MSQGFRHAMTWLHTWVGLLLGWVCFAIFLTGTATYYRWEITRWMQPELGAAATPLEAAQAAAKRLEQAAPDSPQWFVELPDARSPLASLLWRVPGDGRRFERETLDLATGLASDTRASLGGEFFYRFHFQLQLPHPWGRYLAGLAAMAMFVALVTGVVAHRRIFADFFTFRPGRPGLRSWLDFHNLAGVLTLPFCLMISYSALVIFASLYMPWGRRALVAAGGPTEARAVQAPVAGRGSVSDQWIQPAPLGPLLAEADRLWLPGGRTLRRIEVSGRGGARCVVVLTRADGSGLSLGSRETLRFDGATGQPLAEAPAVQGPARRLNDLLYGLHLARFAGPVLRCLLFVLGLLATALVGTGLVMWTLRRRPRQPGLTPSPGQRLVERLNVVFIAGLPAASAGFFAANRLLPLQLSQRQEAEVLLFFAVWGLSLCHAVCRPLAVLWREQLYAGSLLFFSLPLFDFCLTGEWLVASLGRGNWAHLGFDCAMLLCGCVLLAVARRASRPSSAREPFSAPEGGPSGARTPP